MMNHDSLYFAQQITQIIKTATLDHGSFWRREVDLRYGMQNTSNINYCR